METAMRAADADRDRVVALLQEQVGAGRLTLDESSHRATAAYQARTVGELAILTGDLPLNPPAPSPMSHRWLVPVLVVLAVLLVVALLTLAGSAGMMMPHMTGGH